MNCTEFWEFVFMSRERIADEIAYVKGNFSAEEEAMRSKRSTDDSWVLTYTSKAASLASAHLHVHGDLQAARRECLSDQLQIVFMLSLRRLQSLLHGQLRHLWMVLQGTSELFRQAAAVWLGDLTEHFG